MPANSGARMSQKLPLAPEPATLISLGISPTATTWSGRAGDKEKRLEVWWAHHRSGMCAAKSDPWQVGKHVRNLPQRERHHLIADFSDHGDFQAYHLRFNHQQWLNCKCGKAVRPTSPRHCTFVMKDCL